MSQEQRAGGAVGQLADQVRNRADIVDLVSDYVALRPAGRSYKGLCPFHAEKTPSFTVSPDRQLFYCFGCGAGGNVFTFLMKVEGLSFLEALQRLAERVGMGAEAHRVLSGGGQKGFEDRARLAELNQQAALWFARQLWETPAGKEARAYLVARGVETQVARAFRLGYAPDSWHGLQQALGERGYPPELAGRAGLLVARERGGWYDRFRGRLMFAIADPTGRVVGFGGRALQEGQEPKYLNSPETPLYQKSRLLYGLDRARESIRRSGRAVLVEGYMDVVAMHQFGLAEAVASCGTSLTAEHGRLLARFATQVVVAFDSDTAGQAAALRGLRQLREAGLDVRVAVLPKPHDPDSLLREQGRPAMEAVLAAAKGVFEFAVDRALEEADLTTPAGKARAAANVVAILAEVPGVVEQEALLQQAARRLEVPALALRRELWQHRISSGRGPRGRAEAGRERAGGATHAQDRSPYTDRGAIVRHGEAPGASEKAGTKAAEKAVTAGGLPVERAFIRLLLQVPQLVSRVAGKVSAADFSDQRLGSLFEALRERGEAALSDPDLAQVAGEVLAESEVGSRPGEVDAYVRRLREVRLGRELAALESKIAAVVGSAGRGASERLEALAELAASYREVWERLRMEGWL